MAETEVKKPAQTKEQRLAALDEKIKALMNRKQMLASSVTGEQRKKENKRKMLLGAYVLENRKDIEQTPEFHAWLKRDSDRAAFGLEPIRAPAPVPGTAPAATS